MRIFIPAYPQVPDQCLRALSVYTLIASLPMTLDNFEKEFGISELKVFLGTLVMVLTPLLVYYIFYKYPIFPNRYSPVTFEWSYYASLMGVLMIQACLMIGISYGMLLPLMLANTISLIIPMLAVNLRKEGSLVIYRIPGFLTRMDLAILTVYSLTACLIIYFFPLGTISFGDDCLNKWVCSYHPVAKHRESLMATTFWSLSTAFGCLKMWRARELIMELSNEETGEVKQTILERRGWKWVVKGEEKLKIN